MTSTKWPGIGRAEIVQQSRGAHRGVIAPVGRKDIQVSVAIVVAKGDAHSVARRAADIGPALNSFFGEVTVTVVDVEVVAGIANAGITTRGDIEILVTVVVDIRPAGAVRGQVGGETGGRGTHSEKCRYPGCDRGHPRHPSG